MFHAGAMRHRTMLLRRDAASAFRKRSALQEALCLRNRGAAPTTRGGTAVCPAGVERGPEARLFKPRVNGVARSSLGCGAAFGATVRRGAEVVATLAGAALGQELLLPLHLFAWAVGEVPDEEAGGEDGGGHDHVRRRWQRQGGGDEGEGDDAAEDDGERACRVCRAFGAGGRGRRG